MHIIGEMSENVEKVCILFLVQRNDHWSVFPDKRIHIATWISSDRRNDNQIGHVCKGQRCSRPMPEVRVPRLADAGSLRSLPSSVRTEVKTDKYIGNGENPNKIKM